MKSPLNVSVSYFEGYFDIEPKEGNLLELLSDTSQIEQIKKIQNTPDKKDRESLKSHIRQITVSGTFNHARLIENLASHSGLICVDIDFKDNQNIGNFQNLKKIISTAPFVSYISKSVSGLGFFVIIPIENPKKHVEHFLALEALFGKMGIVIDKACKDVSRMRCISHDPDPYINHEATVFKSLIEIPIPKVRNTNFSYQHLEGDSTQSWVEKYIKEVQERRIDITSSYADWVNMGFALASEFGEGGRDYYHDISAIHPDYDSDKCDKQYDRCVKRNGSGVGIGSFFHACKVAGVDLKGFQIGSFPAHSAKPLLKQNSEQKTNTRNIDSTDNKLVNTNTQCTVTPTAENHAVKPDQKAENPAIIIEEIEDLINEPEVQAIKPSLFDSSEYREWLKTVDLPIGHITLNGQVPIYHLPNCVTGMLNHVDAFADYKHPGNRNLFIRRLKYIRRHLHTLTNHINASVQSI